MNGEKIKKLEELNFAINDIEKQNAKLQKLRKEMGDLLIDLYNNGELVLKNQAKSNFVPNGVYIVFADGSSEVFNPDKEYPQNGSCHVAISKGDELMVISNNEYYDARLYKESVLYGREVDNIDNAVADMDGKKNTSLIKLTDSIKLDKGEWIPSVGEFLLIFYNKKKVNKALSAIGEKPISDDWYNSSTEPSASGAWGVCARNGVVYAVAKWSSNYRVRPVSASI